MSVRVLSALGPHRAAWDALVEGMVLPSPFLCSWWLEHAAARPVIVAVFEGDELLGGLALEVDRRLGLPRYLAAGSALAPDHVDLVHQPDRPDPVRDAVWRWIESQRHAVFDLRLINPTGLLASVLGPSAVTKIEAAPTLTLPDDLDAYLRTRPGGLAKRLRRASKRLDGLQAVHEQCGPDTIEDDLVDLRRLHREVFGTTSMFDPHFDSFASVARAAVPAGAMTFHRLRACGTTAAMTVTLQVGQRICAYQGGRLLDREWAGAGAVLDHRIIASAAAQGFVEFDYLRGTAPYKVEWADEARALGRAAWSQGVGGKLAAVALDGVARIKRGRDESTRRR